MSEQARKPVIVVTDSTSDLPRDVVAQYRIQVVPQILMLGDKTWREGVDIDAPRFYELLRSSSQFPKTSQPSAAEFQDLFVRLSQDASGIVAILLSNDLSGTLNSAHAARAALPDLPIEVIDSRSVSMQLGFIVMAAARVAAEGGDLQAVCAAARAMIGKVHVYFIVDTLEYLHRGGRIGGATRLVGSALNLKPVLAVLDGKIEPVARIRTRRKALAKVFELLQQEIPGGSRAHMAVVNVAAPNEAAELVQQVEAAFHPVELLANDCGPVVGAHGGPGTVAVIYYVE